MRVGGRLDNAEISYNAKHQIILPANNFVSHLLIWEMHFQSAHGGPRLTEAVLRQKYWITRSQYTIKAIIRKCVVCFKHNPKAMQQYMSNIPGTRLISNLKPFFNSVIDNTGDIKTKYNKGRGAKVVKSYATIFVCMSTKAVHIELVSDLTATTFIAALRRFIARRGNVRKIYSDNATCFTKANKLLRELSDLEAEQFEDELNNEFNKRGIIWHFNPPAAPHFNGLAEAAVKSVKTHLKRVIGDSLLTYEELSTLLSQIESCVNSRPLCSMSSDSNDFTSLTPGHFLVGQPLLSFPDENHIETKINWLTRWQLVQKMHQLFWDRWRMEYLNQLQVRSKWLNHEKQPEINDLVLIKDDNTMSNKWPMARIIELHPGTDNLVRVVTLKTENNTFKRPITKICLLPKGRGNEDLDSTGSVEARREERSNVLPIITALLTFFTFGATSAISAGNAFSINNISHSPGLMFGQESIAYTSYTDLNIICYFDLRHFRHELKSIKSRVVDLRDFCNRLTEKDLCNNYVNHVEDHLNTIENKNKIINGYASRRSKRAALNFVGNLLGDVFGLMDSRFEEQYLDNLQSISKNENYVVRLLKNQTSIMDSTMNVIKTTESELNYQSEHINKILARIENMTNREEAMQNFFILSLEMTDAMIRFESRQDAIIDIILDVKRNHVNADLITPDQLEQQINLIRAHIDSRKLFVAEDTHSIFKLMRISAVVGKKTLFFRISIPVLNIEKYKIFKIIPVPMEDLSEYAWIQVSERHLIVSWDLQKYNLMTVEQYDGCMKYTDNEVVCSGPKQMFPATKRTCEFDIFSRRYPTKGCSFKKSSKIDTWIETGKNHWFFSLPNVSTLTSICGDKLSRHELHGCGLLTLKPNCILRGEFIQISALNDVGNMEITLPPLPEIWNDNLAKPMRFQHHDFESHQLNGTTNLTMRIHEMENRIQDPIRLNYHDIHHYGLIYLWIICSVIAFAFIIKKVGIPKVKLVAMPNLPSAENVA